MIIFWSVATLKILAGLAIGFTYKFYYAGGDPTTIFEIVQKNLQGGLFEFLSNDIPEWESQPRTSFFGKLISPVVFLTRDYWLTTIYLSLFSFLGYWYLVQILVSKYPNYRWVIVAGFFLIPSSLWSAGILKETIINPAFMICLGVFLKYFWKRSITIPESVLLVIMLLIVFKLRFFYGGFFVIGVLVAVVLSYFWHSKLKYATIVSVLILAIGFFSMEFLHPWMSPDRLPLTILENHQQILTRSQPSSAIQFELESTYPSLLYNFPKAITTSLFRPFIWEHNEWISLPERVENLILATLTLCSLFYWKKIKPGPLLISGLFFIFCLSGFLALSTPNFGTLSRYTSLLTSIYFLIVAYVPFLVISSSPEVNS